MRPTLAFATLAVLLLAPFTAHAAGALPHFAPDTRYAQVRAGMIGYGFAPARVLKRSENSPLGCGIVEPDICRQWPEILHCSEGAAFCEFLFFRKRDGARAIVVTVGDNHVFGCYCLSEVRWADERENWIFEDAVIAKPGASRRARNRVR